MFGRRKIAMLVAEFLGTAVLTLVFLSVQRSTIGIPYFVAVAAGLTVILTYFVVGENSGAHLNPAVTLALWTARKVGTLTGMLYIVMQLLGAWAAYGLYTYFVGRSLQPIGGQYAGKVLVAEAVGAFVLALGWAAAAYRRYTTGNHAAVVGIAYALGVIVASVAGIGLINPAVALGVRAWNIWGSMGWGAYVLGPVLGAVIGVNLFGLLFAPSGTMAVAEASTAKTTTSKKTSRRKK
ncbi:MAG TPA: aquaporin [Candidatus Saccharimonadales bacterium]|nr:aquaporin [Candidatus Saccharimonadales bacterium]